MASSSLLVLFKEEIPHAEQLQSAVQLCLVGYFFWLLVEWQKMQQDAEES
jgi:hypothetical protein